MVAPEHQLGPEVGCFRRCCAERFGVSLIVDPHSGASSAQETHDTEAALSEPHDHRVLSRQLHRYLSFRVARLNTANMIAMIQKRTMTLGSGHPFFSK
jgi:hypothetical protein